MNEELTLALAKFFKEAWNMFTDGPGEDLQWLIERTSLVEEVIATQEDVDNDIAPEGCEAGDMFYVLSKLGHEAWDMVRKHEAKETKSDP